MMIKLKNIIQIIMIIMKIEINKLVLQLDPANSGGQMHVYDAVYVPPFTQGFVPENNHRQRVI